MRIQEVRAASDLKFKSTTVADAASRALFFIALNAALVINALAEVRGNPMADASEVFLVENKRKEERLKALLISALAGDGSVYRRFLIELAGHLRCFLRKRMASMPEEVEDLVQELLLDIHNQRHTYDPKRPLTAWVQAIARYKLIHLIRRRARCETLHDPLGVDDELFAAANIEAAEAQCDLAAILQELPERQRMSILHVKIQGDSVAETAVRVGMSESAVKVGIHRGLKALAARMRMR
jgi:RNA polymerase sigma-70 factor, ECF subfamily